MGTEIVRLCIDLHGLLTFGNQNSEKQQDAVSWGHHAKINLSELLNHPCDATEADASAFETG